jgi:uncharacterized membrane protein (UPF0127 family)
LLSGTLWVTQFAAGAEPAHYLSAFARTHAIVQTSGITCLVLDIYLADTSAEQRQGLMFIERMDEFEGMLFRYSRAAIIKMWMKNTLIPLDMLFIRGDGEIVGIAQRTQPMSTQQISSPEPVSLVLELNGGMSERWRIAPGSRLLSIG